MRTLLSWLSLGTLTLAGLLTSRLASPLLKVTGGTAFPGLATDATGQFDEAALTIQGCFPPGRHSREIRQHLLDRIWKSEVLGYLSPREPIVTCTRVHSPPDFMALPPDKRDLLKLDGNGPYVYWTRYVVKTGTGLQNLDTQADFKARYAPVESAEEALSFVLATTARVHILTPQSLSHLTTPSPSDLTVPSLPDWAHTRYQAEVTQIDGTTTKAIGDKYQVHHLIFDADCNGRSPDTTAYAVDYEVSKTGDLRELRREALYIQSNCPVQ